MSAEQAEVSGSYMRAVKLALAGVFAASIARADDPPESAPAPEPSAAPEAAAAPVTAAEPNAPTPAELAEEIDELYAKQHELERGQRAAAATQEQVQTLLPLRRFITVFVDVGAFAVAGDGSGIRSDIGHVYFPKYMDRIAGQWVFMGDPLSTGINAFGEPSDTSNSRSVATDTINSEGRPSFVVNAVGLEIAKAVRRDLSVNALAELLPRPDDNIVDVQLANIEYRPYRSEHAAVTLNVGKVDSVLGIEYRTQDPKHRLTVTPSLINRYTSGRPIGVRAQLVTDTLNVSASLANGDSFQQLFEPDRELKSNTLPTGSFHVQALSRAVGKELQLGLSGAAGPQDGQDDLGTWQWHAGVDAQLVDLRSWSIAAEYVQGRKQGRTEAMIPCAAAECLRYKGAYLLAQRPVTRRLIPYARLDWRSAVHAKGTEFVYESHSWRATLGGHYAVTSRILGKLEYTFNREIGGVPEFPNDILTTSLVVATD